MTTFTREDYEMAAKAAGVEYDADHAKRRGDKVAMFGLWLKIKGEPYEGQRRHWNPPEDDGDALRLANRLRICVEFGSCEDDAPVIWVGLIEDRRDWPRCAHFPDPNAATRHAIFRAAIAIGRSMP